jgi:hypothetical protein
MRLFMQNSKMPVGLILMMTLITGFFSLITNGQEKAAYSPASYVLEGIVVDKSGNPVANAQIYYHSTEMQSPIVSQPNFHSDRGGKFVIKDIPANEKISIRARSQKAAADPVTASPADSKGPLRLIVDEATSFALRGRLVNDAGQPVELAEIQLMVNIMFGNWGTGFVCGTFKTDTEGKFEVGGLWPGDKYDIQVSAKGYEKYGSRQVTGVAGGVNDFGNIVLIKTGCTVEGTVVDSSGKPVGGVRVFNWGDGPEPIECKSEASGHYLLKGFHSGPVFIFAEKKGYRFTRLRTTADTTGAAVTILRLDEPVPPFQPAQLSSEEQREVARTLLEKLWAGGGKGRSSTAISIMTRIDPDQARQWSKQLGGKYDRMIRRILAEKIAETDVDEAIGMIGQDDQSGYSVLKKLADRFASSDPAKARRLIEEAAIRARAMDQPGKMASLAEIGALMLRLGDEDAGRKIVDEAADLAAKSAGSDANGYACSKVAAAVAAYDIDRALEIVDKLGQSRYHDSGRANVAVAGGLRNLDQALKILKDMDNRYADRARIRLAYRLASTRPEDAAQIVQTLSNSSAFGFQRETKAQILRWMASAIATREKPEAFKLIDAAFELYLGPSEGDYGDARRATQAAALGMTAKEIGYPDMDSVVSRVIASRATMKHDTHPSFSPAAVVDSSVAMAMLLACYDPQTAGQILTSLEPWRDSVGAGYSGVRPDSWLRAWALADPKHALELAKGELAKAKDQRDWDPSRNGLFEMAELWTLSSDERFKRVAQHLHNLAFPDEEF